MQALSSTIALWKLLSVAIYIIPFLDNELLDFKAQNGIAEVEYQKKRQLFQRLSEMS